MPCPCHPLLRSPRKPRQGRAPTLGPHTDLEMRWPLRWPLSSSKHPPLGNTNRHTYGKIKEREHFVASLQYFPCCHLVVRPTCAFADGANRPTIRAVLCSNSRDLPWSS